MDIISLLKKHRDHEINKSRSGLEWVASFMLEVLICRSPHLAVCSYCRLDHIKFVFGSVTAIRHPAELIAAVDREAELNQGRAWKAFVAASGHERNRAGKRKGRQGDGLSHLMSSFNCGQ